MLLKFRLIVLILLVINIINFVKSNSCAVTVTGRNRSYGQVRETIQTEDWQDDIEDEIRKHRVSQRRSYQAMSYYERQRNFITTNLGPLENVYLNIFSNLQYIKSGLTIPTGVVPQGFPGVGKEGTTKLDYNNPFVREGLALLPQDTLIVQVFDDFNDLSRKYRDTAVIFQEHPICVTIEQLKEYQYKNKGKEFNETDFIDQNEDAIDNGKFIRLDFDTKTMYKQVRKYYCARVIMLYGFVARVYVIDNEDCEVGVTCDEDGYPIRNNGYGYGNNLRRFKRDIEIVLLPVLDAFRQQNSLPQSRFDEKQGGKYYSMSDTSCRA